MNDTQLLSKALLEFDKLQVGTSFKLKDLFSASEWHAINNNKRLGEKFKAIMNATTPNYGNVFNVLVTTPQTGPITYKKVE